MSIEQGFEFLQTELDKAHARIRELEAMYAKLLKARDLSAIASATMRDESVAKSKRIAGLEALLRRAMSQIGTSSKLYLECEAILTARETGVEHE